MNRLRPEERRLWNPIDESEKTLITRLEWSGEGQKTQETDPLGRSMAMVYDDLKRVVRQVEGIEDGSTGLRVMHRRYDGNSNLTSTRLENPLGSGDQERSFVYDAANRLKSETDAEGETAFFDYDAAGNLVRSIDRRGTVIEHDYDKRNRRDETRLSLERGRTEATVAITTWTYGGVSNVLTETRANGNVVTNVYDDLDRLTSVTDSVGQVAAFGYDARGNRTSSRDGENHETVTRFDALNRPYQVEMPGDRIMVRTFDVAANVLSEKNPRDFTTDIEYDSLNRQVRVTDPPVAQSG